MSGTTGRVVGSTHHHSEGAKRQSDSMAQPEFNPKLPNDGFVFDPFGLHSQQDDASSTASPQPPPQVNRLTRPDRPDSRQPTLAPDDAVEATRPVLQGSPTRTPPRPVPVPSRTTPRSILTPAPAPVAVLAPTPRSIPATPSPTTPVTAALPPRLVVKLIAHEEVSSVAQSGDDHEGTSDVYIEGKLTAQVTSSDALKNIPFYVVATTAANDSIHFAANEAYSSVSAKPLPQHALSLIHVPKTEISSVPIGTYSLTELVQHMPLVRYPNPCVNNKCCVLPHYKVGNDQYRSYLTSHALFLLLSSWWNER